MRKSAFVAAFLAYLRAYKWYFAYSFVNVHTDKGTLRGFETKSWRGAVFFAFKGVPYAKPPLGDLRFKAPEEEAAWAGVRDALSHGSICPQLDPTSTFLRGEEDCLFLNVYTPSLTTERLPVMVWIHGGGFVQGSANGAIYGPDYFMDADVVLVTLNYRIGALGFLSTEDDRAPGNAGMKDQVAALRWVRRNIAKFGGDPENVTIFGESAGGASVHFHLLSPMSTGLFARAIAQSGSALNIKSLSENMANVTVRLARVLGAENMPAGITGALEFLKTVRYQDIVRVQENLRTPAEKRLRVSSLFTPSVESNVKSEEVFLPDSPMRMLASGTFNKVPFITGYNSHEGYLFYREIVKPETMKAAVEDTKRFVPRDIENVEMRNELAKSIREFYFDDKPIGTENITNLVNLYTDASYVSGIKRATRLQLKSSSTPIYFYVFSYDGGLNLLKNFFNIKLPGASHADDIGYLFYPKLLFWKKPGTGSVDEYVVNTMVRLWTNFAKYGNPTPPGDPLTWKPVTEDKFHYLNISGQETRLAENPDPDRAKFWDEAYQNNSAH